MEKAPRHFRKQRGYFPKQSTEALWRLNNLFAQAGLKAISLPSFNASRRGCPVREFGQVTFREFVSCYAIGMFKAQKYRESVIFEMVHGLTDEQFETLVVRCEKHLDEKMKGSVCR